MRIIFLSLIGLLPAVYTGASEQLIVHEWGTFTSLQNEDGLTLGGINNDRFSKRKYSRKNLQALKQSMHASLVNEGLYPKGMSLTRVMVGRLELITSGQRKLIKEIVANPPDLKPLVTAFQKEVNRNVMAVKTLASMTTVEVARKLGIKLSPAYQKYLALGRFRDAILLSEQTLHPQKPLQGFLKQIFSYRL